MRTPYYADAGVTLYEGKAVEVLAEMDAGSVDCIVTSPPYYGLRDYGVDGQLGAEETPGEYVASLVTTLREARRVLADDGTLWLNLGDSYSGSWGAQGKTSQGLHAKVIDARANTVRTSGTGSIRPGQPPAKNLMGMPWRVALALQDDGWILRNDIIWRKPNTMPESVTDRLRASHEHVFLLTKSPRYWFDLDAIREPRIYAHPPTQAGKYVGTDLRGQQHGGNPMSMHTTGEYQSEGKNPGDVWTIPTTPFHHAHFATFPVALPERCILAGCKPGGVVGDPFSGSGTTGLAAARHGHPYVGIDLNPTYLDLSLRTRLQQPALLAGGQEVAP